MTDRREWENELSTADFNPTVGGSRRKSFSIFTPYIRFEIHGESLAYILPERALEA